MTTEAKMTLYNRNAWGGILSLEDTENLTSSMSFSGQHSLPGSIPGKRGWKRYLFWKACCRMPQKSHRRHHHHRGQQVLEGTGFSLEWAAQASGAPWASGAPSVMEQRWHQTHQCPLWVEGQDSHSCEPMWVGLPTLQRGKKKKGPPTKNIFSSSTKHINRTK